MGDKKKKKSPTQEKKKIVQVGALHCSVTPLYGAVKVEK